MKVTALVLFLILLIVLVVSVILGKSLKKEGFVSYKQNANSSTGSSPVLVSIPTYSRNTVAKMYDTLYFDTANGNLIEVDSTAFKGNVDSVGSTIVSTTITPRASGGSSTQYIGNVSVLPGGGTSVTNLPESQIAAMSTSYNSYVYNTLSKNTDKYCVIYVPWYTNTYIHILDVTQKAHVGTYGMSNGIFNVYNYPSDPNTGVLSNKVGVSLPSNDTDPNNNKFITDNYYDSSKVLYQMSKYVKYDITNGSLIVQTQNTPKTVTVYTRGPKVTSQNVTAPNTISNTPSVVVALNFSPNIIQDTLGSNIVLYIPDGTNTLIAIITATSNGGYTLSNVRRFTANTVDTGSGPSSDNSVMALFNSYVTGNKGVQGVPGVVGAPGPTGGSTGYSDDYILKTQIVPPVCPSCPSCGTGGVCTNCGGKGGSGVQSNSGGTMATGGNGPASSGGDDAKAPGYEPVNNIGSGTFSSNADANTFAGGLTLTGYDTVAGIEDVAKTGADVIKTGIHEASSGIGAVGKGIGTAGAGLAGAAKDTVSGAANLATSAGAGAVDLLKSAGSGAVSLLNKNGSGQGQGQGKGPEASVATKESRSGPGYSQISGAGPQTMDQYSYYGTLPPKKPSPFMPITADFSAFKH